MLNDTLKKRLAKDRPVTSITLRIPVDVVDSLKAIAPHKGFSGYQTLLKALKPSTRQRFVAVEFGFLPPEQEVAVVAGESGLSSERVGPLVALAGRLRALKGHDLEEGVSTRLVVYCATLIAAGMSVADAVLAAMIEPLTDDSDVKAALAEVARAVIG